MRQGIGPRQIARIWQRPRRFRASSPGIRTFSRRRCLCGGGFFWRRAASSRRVRAWIDQWERLPASLLHDQPTDAAWHQATHRAQRHAGREPAAGSRRRHGGEFAPGYCGGCSDGNSNRNSNRNRRSCRQAALLYKPPQLAERRGGAARRGKDGCGTWHHDGESATCSWSWTLGNQPAPAPPNPIQSPRAPPPLQRLLR